VRCPNCERENPDDARFCAGCGRSISNEIACTRCGRLNPPDAAFCNGCGQQLSETAGAAEGAMSRAPSPVAAPQPSSFANGRYSVMRFLGEGG
jgi:RNA polymerase subunit RPABC4/transcription elongation factor Spt4